MNQNCSALALAALSGTCLLASSPASAINATQPVGYGVKNAAMGGAGIALPLDAEAAANNPAGIAFLPKLSNVGIDIFTGQSSTDYFLPGNRLKNSTTTGVPTGGINWPANDRWTFGLSLDAQGVGADYKRPLLPVPGAHKAKSDLRVAEFIPTVAWKPTPELALGASLNVVYEQLEFNGVIVPAPVPGGLAPLPKHGTKSATGIGIRLGALWKFAPGWAVGANYKSVTGMSKLDGYADDLLAYSKGRLDIPAQYGMGVAWTVNDQVTVAADALQIKYGDIDAMHDPKGFAWKNLTVFRLGGSWAVNEALTLRAGIGQNNGQIQSSHLAQNVLAPSLFKRTYTAGVSWRQSPASEFNAALEFNPRRSIGGTDASTGVSLSAKAFILKFGFQHNW